MYKIGSMFNENLKFYQADVNDSAILHLFEKAFEEDNYTAIENLFCLGDIHNGKGDHVSFGTCFTWLIQKETDLMRPCLPVLSRYVTWHEIVPLLSIVSIRDDISKIIMGAINADITLIEERRPCSSLSKALPLHSENAALADTAHTSLGLSLEDYENLVLTLREKSADEIIDADLIKDYKTASDMDMLNQLHHYDSILILITNW